MESGFANQAWATGVFMTLYAFSTKILLYVYLELCTKR